MLQWNIGDVRITRVVELGQIPTPPRFIFQGPPDDLVARHEWLKPHFARDDGKLLMSIHCFVIETQGKRIVVDTCVGNDKKRQNPAWNQLNGTFLDDLKMAGFAPADIDFVLCTHLHVDHVGWNTRWADGAWVPTFDRARYLFARTEWEHWSKTRTAAYGGGDDGMDDSVRPIVDAGLADLVETHHKITDEVWLEPTPGHTPGHVSVRIESKGQRAVITGDLMHHPIQCSEPDLPVSFDSDTHMASQTRRYFLSCCARDKVLVLGTHFANPTAGHVISEGEVWRFKV
jgi:glyoxylase-like metal-dependent hydrolase (beta-lactamase superfamily II)